MTRGKQAHHRKMRWACAGGGIAAAVGVALAATGSFAATSHQPPISPSLQREFAVFAHVDARARAADVAANYPALEETLQNMEQPNDPSAAYELDFSAVVEEQTSAGPALLVPGAVGACMVMQVPVGATETGATAACNTAVNLQKTGSLASTYVDPVTQQQVVYGFANNGTTTADPVDAHAEAVAVPITQNAFAIRAHTLRQVVLRDRARRAVRVITVPNAALVAKQAAAELAARPKG